jgi:PPOX class probable F420-dependent enzyme
MARKIATTNTVDLNGLLEFVRPRHRAILSTLRRDGRTQMSPNTMGVDDSGRLVISSYPHRAKVQNIRRNPTVSVCVLSDDFGDEWVQIYGTAEILDVPESVEPLVEYYRNIAGEHPDWDEYREAMVQQGKSLIRITIDDWGPVARGGFPARLAES